MKVGTITVETKNENIGWTKNSRKIFSNKKTKMIKLFSKYDGDMFKHYPNLFLEITEKRQKVFLFVFYWTILDSGNLSLGQF